MALVFAGASDRLLRDQQGRAWQAWWTAAMPLMKTFPELHQLTGVKPAIRQQTPEEMEAVFRRSERPQ